jgi:hypothetical protein
MSEPNEIRQMLHGVPDGLHSLDIFYGRAKYRGISLPSGLVEYIEMERQPCGCCHDWEPGETYIEFLPDTVVEKIVTSLRRGS